MAKNKITRFSESGKPLVREKGKWKIIDLMGPQTKKEDVNPVNVT